MNVEANRLATFVNWPKNVPVDVSRIARGGFFATGQVCEAQCNWCNQRISDWHYGDQVMIRHRELDPLCPFISNPSTSGNVPINSIEMQSSEMQPPESDLVMSSDISNALPDYTNEQCRLETFANWPISCVTPRSLAKAGFYYYNQSDHVRCAWCQGVIAKWEEGDDPFVEHVKFFPSCPRATLGPNVEIASKEISNIGIVPIQPSKHDQFASLDVRIRSFQNWTKGDIQNPEALATAGFYFLDNVDHVRCFHCSGGLRSWQREDDPWEEHAKWFPKCQFLELVKGKSYIQEIQAHMRPTLDDVLRGEISTKVLEMGFLERDIRTVMKRQIKSTGCPYTNIDELVVAILHLQDNREAETVSGSPSKESSHRRSSGASTLEECKIHSNMKSTEETSSQETASATTATSEPPAPECSKTTLEDENRQLKDARLCKVCMVEEVGIVFLPCGHLVSCVQCAPSVTSCPLCRTTIKAYVRTFLS